MNLIVVILGVFIIYWIIVYLFFLYTFSRKIKVNMEKFMPDGYADILQERKEFLIIQWKKLLYFQMII